MTAGRPAHLHRFARGAPGLGFFWPAGRCWHPYYGFNAFSNSTTPPSR